jgi:hypothetical protein
VSADGAIVRGADLDNVVEVRRAVRLMGGSLRDAGFVGNVACVGGRAVQSY